MWKEIVLALLLTGTAQAQDRSDRALLELEIQTEIGFIELWRDVSNEMNDSCKPKNYARYIDYLTRVSKLIVGRQESARKTLRSLNSDDRVELRRIINEGIDRDLHQSDSMQKTLQEKMMELADQALKERCLTIADHHYRMIIDIFSGSAFTALRQRAQIGINDVRSSTSQQR
jgi:hypothetical protein